MKPLNTIDVVPFVKYVIKGLPPPPSPLDYDDLLQEGTLIAHDAVRKHNIKKCKLHTFVITKIKQHLIDLYRKYGNLKRDKTHRYHIVEFKHDVACGLTPERIAIARETLQRINNFKPRNKCEFVAWVFIQTLDIKTTAKICKIHRNAVDSIIKKWRDMMKYGGKLFQRRQYERNNTK